LVARSDRCAIAIGGLVVYTLGFEAVVRLRLRDVDPWIDPLGHRYGPSGRFRNEGQLPDDLLRMGVELADGIKATSTDEHFRRPDEPPPSGYFQMSGGGGGQRWDFTCWVWPLPAKPPTTFVVEWPALGIQLTRYELPTEEIVQAGKRSVSIWD
jgi:hypothetical protein